ncbi:hypothetical protein Micbo1qcDRAFT_225276 [Microdochium bolleyi]|uniref:Uncharacterized protein n=1 Tax=Microdochium bolleyi TaxID=196109 RepID=A0A136J2M8_9PEZI|nr:hypothetical protein Micbo1qcDRAFT_225276 [Microdochium bolleyi]
MPPHKQINTPRLQVDTLDISIMSPACLATSSVTVSLLRHGDSPRVRMSQADQARLESAHANDAGGRANTIMSWTLSFVEMGSNSPYGQLEAGRISVEPVISRSRIWSTPCPQHEASESRNMEDMAWRSCHWPDGGGVRLPSTPLLSSHACTHASISGHDGTSITAIWPGEDQPAHGRGGQTNELGRFEVDLRESVPQY